MSSKAARLQKNWTSSEKPGDKTGDEAILEWLRTPRNAARFIRLWNNIAEGDSKTTFSAELATFVNKNSSPQRTPLSIQKRAQRFDELLKESKTMLSNGASERAILKHFPHYHECMKCMESGLELIRQELDASGEKDSYYDKIFEVYQSHITQRTRSDRRPKSSSIPDTPSPILSSRDTSFDMPASPSSLSSSSSHVDKRNAIVEPSNPTSSSLKRRASQNTPIESPPRPNKRGFRIESDSTSPCDSRLRVDPTLSPPATPSPSSSSSSHQTPTLSRPISTPRHSLHIPPDTPASSKSIPLQPREQPKKKRVSHQQPTHHHPQQHSDTGNTEVISQELTQLLQETNKNIRRIMKINQRIEKRRLLVEKRKLALSRSREMERKADLINTMLESGFSKEEINQIVNK